MGKRNYEKIASLSLSLILPVIYGVNGAQLSLYAGCTLCERLLYPLFHANIIHLLLNTLSMLSLIFLYNITFSRMALAYIVAVSIPAALLGSAHVVGLSGVVYFLLGSISFEVGRPLYYQCSILFTLLFSLLMPLSATAVHAYCYTIGVAVALLNMPFKRRC